MPVRPFIKSCNQIQFHSESHSPFSQQLDWAAVSLQPLSQHGEAQPEEHLHAPPSLHEHWLASHAQSLHVQSSPQHMHAVALEPLNVARANGVATTALSSANPANDLINIEFSLVNKWNSKYKKVDEFQLMSPYTENRLSSIIAYRRRSSFKMLHWTCMQTAIINRYIVYCRTVQIDVLWLPPNCRWVLPNLEATLTWWSILILYLECNALKQRLLLCKSLLATAAFTLWSFRWRLYRTTPNFARTAATLCKDPSWQHHCHCDRNIYSHTQVFHVLNAPIQRFYGGCSRFFRTLKFYRYQLFFISALLNYISMQRMNYFHVV